MDQNIKLAFSFFAKYKNPVNRGGHIKLLITALVLATSSTAFASNICSQILKSKSTYSAEDYRISELESAYLDLVAEASRMSSTAENLEKRTESFLLKKAAFLNRISSQIFRMKLMSERGVNSRLSLVSVSNMLLSLGLHPKIYGIVLNENNQFAFARNKEPKSEIVETPKVASRGIGFVQSESSQSSDDVISKKTIGFVQMDAEDDAPPARRGGSIKLSQLGSSLSVADLENLTVIQVPSQLMSMSGAETSEKRMTLSYDKIESEWIVEFESLTNPSGHIGFHSPNSH